MQLLRSDLIKQLTGSEMGPVNSYNGAVIKRYQNFNYLVNVRFLLVVYMPSYGKIKSRTLPKRRPRLRTVQSGHLAGIAQLVEQLICNQPVGGSDPSSSAKKMHTAILFKYIPVKNRTLKTHLAKFLLSLLECSI